MSVSLYVSEGLSIVSSDCWNPELGSCGMHCLLVHRVWALSLISDYGVGQSENSDHRTALFSTVLCNVIDPGASLDNHQIKMSCIVILCSTNYPSSFVQRTFSLVKLRGAELQVS